jgi:hypothetical protein
MEIEITNATYGTKTVKYSGRTFQVPSASAVARVTINGETREFSATLVSHHGGTKVWHTLEGMAAVYPTGTKVHNVGLSILARERTEDGDANEREYVTAGILAGRSSRRARHSPRCVGFFNDCANAASPAYRR